MLDFIGIAFRLYRVPDSQGAAFKAGKSVIGVAVAASACFKLVQSVRYLSLGGVSVGEGIGRLPQKLSVCAVYAVGLAFYRSLAVIVAYTLVRLHFSRAVVSGGNSVYPPRQVVLVHRPLVPQLIFCAVQVAVGFPGAASAAPRNQFQSTHLSRKQLLLSEIQLFLMNPYKEKHYG